MEKRKSFLDMSKRHQRRVLAAMSASDNVASSSAVDSIDDIPGEGGDVEIIEEERDMILTERSSSSSSSEEERMADIDGDNMDVDVIDNVGNEETLAVKLSYWTLLFGISHTALSALLLILNIVLPAGQLPKDARTLLSTPRKTVIRRVSPGNYFHYGLLRGIVDELKGHSDNSEIRDTITIDIGIDGLPIAKSSKSQLWPILGRIRTTVAIWNPFLIGFYFILWPTSSGI